MPLPKFCSPFPRLSLSDREAKELQRLTTTMVTEVVGEYEQFLWKQQSMLNPRHWSLVREKEDVRVYKDRRVTASTHSSSKTQELLTVGSLLGELDDALYGALSPTTETMRLLAAYTHDRMANCAVLTTLKSPTPNKPFRSVVIKWIVTELPLHLRALAKKRDLVVIESTGTRTLSNGETVGFQLLHSVELSQAPPLPQHYVRAGLSSCCIWRQQSDDRVQIYARTFVQSHDTLLAATTLRATSEWLVAITRSMQCAQMKKLAWLLRTRKATTSQVRAKSTSRDDHHHHLHASSSHGGHGGERSCEICPSAQTSRRGAKSMCTICSRLVCSACRVKRELCTFAPDGRLLQQRVAFCVPCHSIATRAAAADVASEEATQVQQQLQQQQRDTGRDSIGPQTSGLVYLTSANDTRRNYVYRLADNDDDDDDDDDENGSDVDRYGYGYATRKSLPSASSSSLFRTTMDADEIDAVSPLARMRSASDLTTVILGDI